MTALTPNAVYRIERTLSHYTCVLWNLPHPSTASAEILLHARVGYEFRRWGKGLGPKPDAAKILAWAVDHGVTFERPRSWWANL